MPERNKKFVKRSINVLNNQNFTTYSNFLAENIKWNIVGMPIISGKEEFIKALKSLELENFISSNIKNIISEGEFVVVESKGNDNGQKVSSNKTAYCDIYRLRDCKIYEITSYIVDATSANENEN